MERFDIFNARADKPPAPATSVDATVSASNTEAAATPEPKSEVKPVATTNGHRASPASLPDASPMKRSADSEDAPEMANGSPAKKRRKPSMDADAVYAAKLQAEEDKLARPTRGGNSRKTAPAKKKKTPKKKTSARIRASDDSDVDDSESGEKKPQRTTGFHVRSVPYSSKTIC